MKKLAERARHAPSFSVAITPSLTAIAPALLQAASTRLPKLNLRLAGMNDRSAESLLESGELDAVLRYSDWKKGGMPLVWGSLVLVTRPGYVGTGDMPFPELAGEKLLLPFVGNPLRRLMDDTASQTGTKLNIVAEIEGTAPRKEAVLAGLGSTVAIWQSVARECAAGWLNARRIVEPVLRRLLVVDHRKGVDLQTFQIVQEEAASLLGGPYTTAA
jgi:DNA-binding transcriptional LysR family regulator